MSLNPEFPGIDEALAKPEAMVRVPVGFASPLWGFFAGAAVSGAAWWWMIRWARPDNLEAMFAAAGTTAADAFKATPAGAPSAATLETEAEVFGAAEAIVEPPVLEVPVGGEAAPIAPAAAVEAPEPEAPQADLLCEAAAPKPRVRKAEPKPE